MTDISSNKTGEMLGRAYKGAQNQGYLSAQEVAEAVAKVRMIHSGDGDGDDGAMALQFSAVDHLEWSKAELLSMLELEQAPERSARVTSMCVATNETFIDVVPLDLPCSVVKGENADDVRARSSSTATKDAVQPPMSPTEYESVAAAIKDYQPLKDTLTGAGLDPSRLQVDAWCVGYSDADDGPHDRQSFPVLLYQGDGDDVRTYIPLCTHVWHVSSDSSLTPPPSRTPLPPHLPQRNKRSLTPGH
jgi:Cu2+-containing amine oxidase